MIKRIFILVFLLWVVPSSAQLAASASWVSNPDGILSPQVARQIDILCTELNDKHIAQVAVLVLDTVPDDQLDMFAHRKLNELGVGEKGRDNGLVISVVRQQRDIQFETGYGLEGVLPDALCKRIQSVYMVGPLGAGNFDKGVLDGVTAVYNVLMNNKEELGALNEATSNEGNALISGVVALFLLLIAIVVISMVVRGGKKGGGGNDDAGSSGTGTGSLGGPSMGGFLGGLLLGGGLGEGRGGSFGGGGFGGGFGGGMSGGGGARSGF